MRFIEYLRRRRLGLSEEASRLTAYEESELGHQDDLAVGAVILVIIIAYFVVQIIDAYF